MKGLRNVIWILFFQAMKICILFLIRSSAFLGIFLRYVIILTSSYRCFVQCLKLQFKADIIFVWQTADRTLDAPDLVDDYYLNLLDWSSANIVAIALDRILYLWNATNHSIEELTEVKEDDGPITSVSWAPDGLHIAVGLNNSEVQVWDSLKLKKVLSAFHVSCHCLFQGFLHLRMIIFYYYN